MGGARGKGVYGGMEAYQRRHTPPHSKHSSNSSHISHISHFLKIKNLCRRHRCLSQIKTIGLWMWDISSTRCEKSKIWTIERCTTIQEKILFYTQSLLQRRQMVGKHIFAAIGVFQQTKYRTRSCPNFDYIDVSKKFQLQLCLPILRESTPPYKDREATNTTNIANHQELLENTFYDAGTFQRNVYSPTFPTCCISSNSPTFPKFVSRLYSPTCRISSYNPTSSNFEISVYGNSRKKKKQDATQFARYWTTGTKQPSQHYTIGEYTQQQPSFGYFQGRLLARESWRDRFATIGGNRTFRRRYICLWVL